LRQWKKIIQSTPSTRPTWTKFFQFLGKNVAGYDKTKTQLTSELQESGIKIHFEDNINLIADNFKNTENTLVVITPAVPKNHTEWNFFLDNEFTVKKRAEVLGIITKDTFCFAVAGTHGKTTTSSINLPKKIPKAKVM
jgi:UDP-N-acetylmuramate--alanine ligase